MQKSADSFLRALFKSAVDRADPRGVLADALPPQPTTGRVIVLGAGKAAASMAAALEEAWSCPLEGVVVTRYGHSLPLKQIELMEASHPVPDTAGAEASARILALAESAGTEDTVIFLASGGASALLSAPADGISLDEKRSLTSALLKSGASIHEMNAVRKHLSAVKGGQVAVAAAPAKLTTFAISDVPGDDPDVIGSGPTWPDASTLADAKAVLAHYGIVPAPSIRARLNAPDAETSKPGDPVFENATFQMIATPQASLEAARDMVIKAGLSAPILSDRIEGEARDVAKVLGALALATSAKGDPFSSPAVLLSGGETTVTVRGSGRGGRNVEFLLSLAITLDGAEGISAIACDTDGIDGSEDNAGAIITPTTLARAKALGIDVQARLADNDAYSVFAALGDLVVTGPTLTNVNDFRAILVGGEFG